MTTTQSAPAILHAHFEHAVLMWELKRGDSIARDGAFPADTPDPLAELRQLEIRMGATVRIKTTDLAPAEIPTAKANGWELV